MLHLMIALSLLLWCRNLQEMVHLPMARLLQGELCIRSSAFNCQCLELWKLTCCRASDDPDDPLKLPPHGTEVGLLNNAVRWNCTMSLQL